MDLNGYQDNKILNLKCLEHKKQILYIYLKDDTNSHLACSTCFVQKALPHNFIIEIDDFLNNNEVGNLKKLLPEVSKQCQQYLDSESIKNSNKDELIEKVTKQFDEFADVILSNIDKIKKQLINHITSTEEQRSNIIKIMNQTNLIEDLKQKIDQFSDDPMKLNDQLKQIISAYNTCLLDDKKKIEDCVKNHMNQAKQIDLKYIENSLESILQKIISTNILLDDNKLESNSMSIQFPQSSLIEKILQIKSIEQLKSIPNLLLHQNIDIDLQEQNIRDEEILEMCNELKQLKKLNFIELDFDQNNISDQGTEYLCELISEMKYLIDFKLFLAHNKDITKIGVSQLTKALSFYHSQIKSLSLSLCQNKNITDSVILTSIIPLYKSCINLSELGLYLSDTKISENTVREIADMLKSLPQLKNLYLALSENNIEDESFIYLNNEGIKPLNSKIQELYLWLDTNYLENQSAIELMNTISTCSCLKELSLDISNNKIGKKYLQQLEQFELELKDQHCKNLKYININYDNQE